MNALVVTDDNAVGIVRVDPEVVVVTSGSLRPLVIDVRQASVIGTRQARREKKDLVLVIGQDSAIVVVARAPAQVATVVDQLPVPAAVV